MKALPFLLAALALGGSAAAQAPHLLDDFAAPSAWRAEASDGVSARAERFEGGLRLDYDFSRGSGYAFIRRDLPLELPDNFELRFRLRGEGPANALEIKLTDASGENVWWHRKPDYVPPGEWTSLRVRRRQIEFAWGPTGDRTLRRTAAIEFVVAAGTGGGRGWIAVDDLQIVPLPLPPDPPPRVTARGDGARALDRDPTTSWSGAAGDPIDLDLGYLREFGGLKLQWVPGRHAADYAILLSPDGRSWTPVRKVIGGDGGTDWIRLEESEAHFVRITPAAPSALAEVEVQPLAFGASDNAFVSAVAAAERRGIYPRGFVGEQNYWTLVATPAGGDSGLMDESGAIEAGRGGFSVEPFIRDGDRLVTWADVEPVQSLAGGELPIPSVTWPGPGWRLRVTGIAEHDRLIARYRLENRGSRPRDLTLVLAARPFQVNPPQQFLNISGGVSPIRALAWDGAALRVNGAARILPAQPPDEVRLGAFDSGSLPQAIATAASAPVEDPTGLASGALVYRFHLESGQAGEVDLVLALAQQADPIRAGEAADAEEAATAAWREALGDVVLRGPAAAQPAFATLRSALAQVLMTRDGPALRPGSRSYARAWIRDGAMMSTALLRMGVAQPAIDFLEYYAPYQYPDGKVPCCVDARGADPVPEHDSHGELIHLVAQVHRFAPDLGRLRRLWPRVRAAADHIEALRQRTRIPANRTGPNRPLYGLLPPSISHEGYSARPAYSYWDDFWALTGLQDAAWLARVLARADEARALSARAAALRVDIVASTAAAREVHGIDFIPGAADLGDFDATSTTIGLSVAGLQAHLPADALERTFERYWAEFIERRDGRRDWEAYTPYEWRNVGAFARLGWRERIPALFDFFMADRRPVAWNQWAEVVGRNPREPRFIGDMPHGWVASDHINALLDMLAYERADGALVLGAGVPDGWLADGGISVERLRTPYGPLTFTLRSDGERLNVSWRLDGREPPGGIMLGLVPGRRLSGRTGEAELPR